MDRKLKAFTLTELVVAFLILGILILLAYPDLMSLVTKAKSTEAQLQLNHLHMLEKNYFYAHSKYTSDLGEIGFEQQKLVTEDGAANYIIEVTEAGDAGYVATATSITDFDQDGTFNVWQIDQDKKLKETVKD
ncbi:MAG: prepilin-type N-terminal cleavage/methylation domain-containing protein [Flavobacteriales bacterium]|nr:prepilin-type N-terminal cleavage/methylation domain-containing protein [Flavobacteriales bacterium]